MSSAAGELLASRSAEQAGTSSVVKSTRRIGDMKQGLQATGGQGLGSSVLSVGLRHTSAEQVRSEVCKPMAAQPFLNPV